MTNLTQAQSALLITAAQAADGAVDMPQGAKAPITALIKRGLFMSVPHADGPSRLIITEQGRAAVATPAPLQAPVPKDRVAEPADAPAAQSPKGKIARMVALLLQPGGTTIQAMMEATGWQAHSVRGALSGTIKKGLGIGVTSEKTEAGRIYRAVRAAQA